MSNHWLDTKSNICATAAPELEYLKNAIFLDFTGCSGPFEPNWPDKGQPWIALVQRGECTFNQKIQNALELKASGILIYDLPDGGGVLQSMKVEDSEMPSVFTYHWKGMEIAKLVQEHQIVNLSIKKGSHCTSAAKGENPKNPSQVRLFFDT